MAEWRRTDLGYAARIAHLSGSTSGGLNGSYVLNDSTLDDDNDMDAMAGPPGESSVLRLRETNPEFAAAAIESCR